MKRGEIWTVAGGIYASKPRPALIVQDDRFSATDSVIVLPLTSHGVDAPLLRIPVTASPVTGLSRESYVMIDKLTAVRRSNVQSRVGQVPPSLIVEVERHLMVFLGLAG